jgi:protein phosphatase
MTRARPGHAALRQRSRLRMVIAAVAVAAVLISGALLARMWVYQQYYVGVYDGRVAIFQGVRGTVPVLGIALNELAQQTDVALDDLPESLRQQVEEGILVRDGLESAQATVERLRSQVIKVCPVPAPLGVPGAAPTPAPDPALTPTPPAQLGAPC